MFHSNINDFGAEDKKEKMKFIKMKSIFVMPSNPKYNKIVNEKEKELMKIQKEKEKTINVPKKETIDTKKVTHEIKKEIKKEIKPEVKINENLLLLDRSKKIKRD